MNHSPNTPAPSDPQRTDPLPALVVDRVGMPPESFHERFCRHFGVPAERYGPLVMRRTFYRHACWLRWLCSYDSLSADRVFIASVGRLTRRRDFPGEVTEFREDDRNLKFWRRVARFRVSCGRMQALFHEVWPATAATTGAPQAAEAPRAAKRSLQPPPAGKSPGT